MEFIVIEYPKYQNILHFYPSKFSGNEFDSEQWRYRFFFAAKSVKRKAFYKNISMFDIIKTL